MKYLAILVWVTASILVSASTNLLAETNLVERTRADPPELHAKSFRDYLEMFAFGATIATTIAAFVALYQLRLARRQLNVATAALEVAQKDIQVRSQREAVALAAERCEDLANVKFPAISKSIKAIEEQGIQLRQWGLRNKSFDDTSLEDSAGATLWLQQVHSKKMGCV